MGRIATLLSHYWREDDPSELTAAIARDWADILEGIPQDALSKACTAYLRNEPRRKPTPGAIYALAREFIPRPAIVPPPDFNRPPLAERQRIAQEVLGKAGYQPKTFGGQS